MSNTIQNLFPMTNNRAEDFKVVPCYVEFSAAVDNGKYVFDNIKTPPKVFGKLLQGQKGIIAGVMVSANCTDQQFTEAVNGALFLQILHAENDTPVNMAPFPFANFSQGGNFQEQWQITASSMIQEEAVKLSVTGAVDQLTGMSQNELILKVSFNFIRVGAENLKG